jgi:aquaporin Z
MTETAVVGGRPVAAGRATPIVAPTRGALAALRAHWPEYAIEAGGLGLFMVSASTFATLLEHPASPIRQAMGDPLLRRIPMGLAMALTAVSLIYSRWGKRSGAHLNPAVTLTFWRLQRVEGWDALFYAAAQFAGAVAGIGLAALLLGGLPAHAVVKHAATVPGPWGTGAAFLAEAAITFILMSVVLRVSNRPEWNRFTGLCAGALVATYIIVEAPVSGMSMNPARTLGSAAHGRVWTALWVYFTAPPLGMLAAAQVYLWQRGAREVRCAKLHHDNRERCIFRCGWGKDHADDRAG